MTILTVNSGSSSLKVAVFDASGRRLLAAALERIGVSGGQFLVTDDSGVILRETRDFPDHDAALARLFDFLSGQAAAAQLALVGHRVVYGGRQYSRPHAITPAVLADLRAMTPFAPEHMPHQVRAIEAVTRAHPDLKQYACFDTAFHAVRPEVSKQYPIDRALWDEGVVRYGFHGLSYSYILDALTRESPEAARGRVIMAHLGNGASLAAVREARPIDTTMGFTPAGGIMMGTRSGDLDPGVLLYLQEQKGMTARQVSDLVNRRSGLLGVSASSSDMRDLLARESADPRAAEAVALYCYIARKHLGALAATLGGLDTLIFTAGIGENSPSIRLRICANLEFLGVRLEPERNGRNAPVISPPGSPVTVRVMRTDEDQMIARQARLFL